MLAQSFEPGGVPAEVRDFDFSLSGFERDLVALNLGGERFLNVSGVSGADSITDGRAGVRADFDNDGDEDLFITAQPSKMRRWSDRDRFLFRNEVGHEAGWIRVTLEGRASGRDAWGAVVRVRTPAGTQARIKSAGSGFLSQSDPRLLFGLGDAAEAAWIEVAWPAGETQRFSGVPARTSVRLVEGAAEPVVLSEPRALLPDPRPAEARRWDTLALTRGEPLPALALEGPKGTESTLRAATTGASTLVSIWATWCSACRDELAVLQDHHTRGAEPRVVAVSVDEAATRAGVAPALASVGVTYPSWVLGPNQLGAIFRDGVPAVPLFLLVGADGRLEQAWSGWSRDLQRLLTSEP